MWDGSTSSNDAPSIWKYNPSQTKSSSSSLDQTQGVAAAAVTGGSGAGILPKEVTSAVTEELKMIRSTVSQQAVCMTEQRDTIQQMFHLQRMNYELQCQEDKVKRLRWATEDLWSQTFLETFVCRGYSMEFHHGLLVDIIRAFRFNQGISIPGRYYLYPSRNVDGIPMGKDGDRMVREALCCAVQYLIGKPPRLEYEAGIYVMYYE